MRGILLTVDEHGNVSTGGTYFGPRQRLIKRRGSLLVTHVPGHSTFAGQGRQRYEEANYHVFRIDHPTGEPGQWKVDHMLTFSARPYPPLPEELERWTQEVRVIPGHPRGEAHWCDQDPCPGAVEIRR